MSYSTPHAAPTETLLHALEQPTPQTITPYTRLDEQHLANARSEGLKTVTVPNMNLTEAAGLFDLWSKKGWGRSSRFRSALIYVG